MTPARWIRVRGLVQALSLLGFTTLVVYTSRTAVAWLSATTLVRLDPLAALAAMLAERRWLPSFLPALALIALALFLGRSWCGWLCPLGTLIDWATPRRARPGSPASRWHGLKYAVLFATLFAALWGNLTLLVLDPITLFVRSVATAVLPALTWLVTRVEFALYRLAFMRDVLTRVDGALRGTAISYEQGYLLGAVWVAAALAGVLALNLLVRRAWCRYLCPLGGLLALLGKVAWLKRHVTSACVSCGACARTCRMGTIDPKRGYASDSGECTLCLDCAQVCPTQAITFTGEWRLDRGWPYDPSRRQVIGALGASLAGVALLHIDPAAAHPNPQRLRPPGAEEATLLSACVRCGACLRACPTQGLQPSLAEAGLEGLWTPILVPRLGHCEYSCTACGQVCPSGALPRLEQPDKLLFPIGKAYVDPALCIPWSGRADCIVCEEMCPVPQKAIVLADHTVVASSGESRTYQVPMVEHERCIGCGLCEFKCPVQGEAAIRVRLDPLG